MSEIVVRESCPECGETRLYNNFYIRPGHHMRVYVECPSCGRLVSRYIIHAYVDPNYDYLSLLKGMAGNVGESGRKTLDDLELHRGRAADQFKKVKELLRKSSETRRVLELMGSVGVVEDG